MFLAVISVAGTFGNFLIIAAVLTYPKLRTRANAFVINLAVADVCVTAYIMPVGLASSRDVVRPYQSALCGFNAFVMITTCAVSIWSLSLVALERYVHICRYRLHHRLFSRVSVCVAILLVWVLSMTMAGQGWTGWTAYMYTNDTYICLFDAAYDISYSLLLAILGILVPIICLIVSYARIFMAVRRSSEKLRAEVDERITDINSSSPSHHLRLQREMKLVVTMLAIVVSFVICWTPAAVAIVWGSLVSSFPELVCNIIIWVAVSNSAMNSLLYGLLNTNFRTGYRHALSELYRKCHDCWSVHRTSPFVQRMRGNKTSQSDPEQSGGTAHATLSSGSTSVDPRNNLSNFGSLSDPPSRSTVDTDIGSDLGTDIASELFTPIKQGVKSNKRIDTKPVTDSGSEMILSCT